MSETKIFKGGAYLLSLQNAAEVATPEDLNEEQRMIAETAHDFAIKVHAQTAQLEENKRTMSKPLLRELGDLGLLGLEIPEDYGGMGLDKVTTNVVIEEIARSGAFTTTFGAHTGIGTLPIVYFGTEEQKKKYLPKLATGEWVAAYCLTEAGSGSDALGARTTAKLSDDGKYWILNGTKQWITNGGFADVFVVYAKIDGEKFSAFIVERSYPGVSIGPEEHKLGLHASSTTEVILEDCKVPVDNLLGEIGKGHVIAFNILNIGRWKLGAGTVGSAKALIGVAAEYAKTRKQFGKPIAEFRAIQEKLAEMNVRTYVAEAAAYRTAGLIDANMADVGHNAEGREAARRIEEYAIECSINKVLGSEVLDFVADEALQIHGGYGYMEEYEVSRAYRDSRINRIFEGTNEINRLLIPGTLVRRTMKGEIPLMKAMMGLQDELMELTPFEESDEPLAQEIFMLDRSKKVFLMLSGLGVQKFQMALENEQELLMAMADIAIEIFSMESAVLRAQKALKSGKPGLHVEIATVYCQEAFERIATIARTLLPAVEEDSDTLRTQLSMLKRLTRYTPANVVGLKRKIAERVLEKSSFVC